MSVEQQRSEGGILVRHRDVLLGLEIPITDIVLFIRDDVPRVANSFAEHFPAATIHVLGARRELHAQEHRELHERVSFSFAPSEQTRLTYLQQAPRPQVIIEAGNRKRAHKLSSLRN